jgi:hypothetical protein
MRLESIDDRFFGLSRIALGIRLLSLRCGTFDSGFNAVAAGG